MLPLWAAALAAFACPDSLARIDSSGEYADRNAAPDWTCDPEWTAGETRPPRVHSAWGLGQTGNHRPRMDFRHASRSEAWQSRISLRNDTLSQAQLAYRRESLEIRAGNGEDSTLPLRPGWMPRRNLPYAWTLAENVWPWQGTSPARIGARTSIRGVEAFALRAFGALRPSGSDRDVHPWSLRHEAAGLESHAPGRPSLHFGRTRISGGGLDSVSETWAGLGLSSPAQGLQIHGAWNGSRQNPGGGFAWGVKTAWPLGHAGFGEIVLRHRLSGWLSAWDPGWAQPEEDSLSSPSGSRQTGEFALRFRLPTSTHSFLEGEGWQAVSEDVTRHAGMRGKFSLQRPGLTLDLRGAQSQSVSGVAAVFHSSLYGRGRAGEKLKWEWKTRRAWGPGAGREDGFGAEWKWGPTRWKPGLLWRSDAEDAMRTSISLATRIRLTGAWSLEAQGSAPLSGSNPLEWRATMRFAETGD